MKRLTNWQFGLLVLAAVGLGTLLSVVIGRDRSAGPSNTTPGSSVLLADPLDPPQKHEPEPPAKLQLGSGGEGNGDAGSESTLGDRSKLTVYKEQLKARVSDGGASDGERRMLRALCRQLGDKSCTD